MLSTIPLSWGCALKRISNSQGNNQQVQVECSNQRCLRRYPGLGSQRRNRWGQTPFAFRGRNDRIRRGICSLSWFWKVLQKDSHFQKKMRLPKTIIGKTNIYESFVKNTILLKLTFSLIDGTDCSYSLCWWRSQEWALLTWLLRVGWVRLPRVGRRHPDVNSKALTCNLQCIGGSSKENSNVQNREATWQHSISHTWRSLCSFSASNHNYFYEGSTLFFNNVANKSPAYTRLVYLRPEELLHEQDQPPAIQTKAKICTPYLNDQASTPVHGLRKYF